MSSSPVPADIKDRDAYIGKIMPFAGQPLIKVLTGQRRVGKSYLLFQLMRDIRRTHKNHNIIYINKEDLAFDFIRTEKDLHDYVLSRSDKRKRNFIFIDEIQDIDGFERALRSLLLDKKNDLYITGSNARLLSGELATYLSGRHLEFQVHSLSYPEFLRFHRLADSDDAMRQYFTYGGLPYLINLPLNQLAFEYLRSVYNTIVLRDVVARHSIRNTVLLERLAVFMADNIGGLFSAKSISDFLKAQRVSLAPNQIQHYAACLGSAFLVHQTPRYDIKGRRIFESGEKFYFENLGIRNAMVGYRPSDRGKILENAVHNHLLWQGWDVKVGALASGEIDFVCQKDRETMYVQVTLNLTSPKVMEREFGNLLAIPDNHPKLVVTGEPFSGDTHKGVRCVYARDFLREEF